MDNAAPINPPEEELIKVRSSRFGTLEIKSDHVITMTRPFLGFPESTSFFLIPHSDNSPLMWIHSLDDPDLAFVVISHTNLPFSYLPEISTAITRELDTNRDEELELLLILTIPRGDTNEITVNLLGPIIINSEKKLARQLVLDAGQYNPCHPLFPQA